MVIFAPFIRPRDPWGEGYWHASRDSGRRRHEGIDLVCWPGTPVVAPLMCRVVREARPYADDSRYSGLMLEVFEGLEIKIFYLQPSDNIIGTKVRIVDVIGHAQDLRKKYEGITPHLHVEAWFGGGRVDPSRFLGL